MLLTDIWLKIYRFIRFLKLQERVISLSIAKHQMLWEDVSKRLQ